jgi:hypothetical protein
MSKFLVLLMFLHMRSTSWHPAPVRVLTTTEKHRFLACYITWHTHVKLCQICRSSCILCLTTSLPRKIVLFYEWKWHVKMTCETPRTKMLVTLWLGAFRSVPHTSSNRPYNVSGVCVRRRRERALRTPDRDETSREKQKLGLGNHQCLGGLEWLQYRYKFIVCKSKAWILLNVVLDHFPSNKPILKALQLPLVALFLKVLAKGETKWQTV